MSIPELWAATSNKGKMKEFRTLLEPLKTEIKSCADLPSYSSPEETGETFIENARIKAKSLSAMCPNQWVFAEDSGLEVDGLEGKPGVHSARYAGENASDAENNAKLLQMMKIRSPKNRSARFRAAIVLLSPEGEEQVFEGVLEGQVAEAQAGSEGFGYDVVFIAEGQEKTNAELGLAFKNKVSHRAKATRELLGFLQNMASGS